MDYEIGPDGMPVKNNYYFVGDAEVAPYYRQRDAQPDERILRSYLIDDNDVQACAEFIGFPHTSKMVCNRDRLIEIITSLIDGEHIFQDRWAVLGQAWDGTEKYTLVFRNERDAIYATLRAGGA